MKFEITISGEGHELTPSIQALVAAVAQGNAAVNVSAPEQEAEKPKQTRKNQTKKEEAPAEQSEEKDEKPATTADEPGTESENNEPEDEQNIPTDVEIRAKATEIGQKDPAKKAKIKELLDKYESKNISSIPEDKRVSFMADLEKL